jgi:transcriptional regulator with XRE-family HTH domain
MKKLFPDFDPKPICLRLKHLRESVGFKNPSEFSREVNINYTTYIKYESDRTPPAEFLCFLAQKYNFDLNWLLTGQGTAPGECYDNEMPNPAIDKRNDSPSAESVDKFEKTTFMFMLKTMMYRLEGLELKLKDIDDRMESIEKQGKSKKTQAATNGN